MIVVCDIRNKKEKKMKLPYDASHKYIDGVEYKICSRCNEWYPMNIDRFYKNKSSPDDFNPYCKECTIKKSVKWQSDNYEKYQEWFTERNRKFGNDYYRDIKQKWTKENRININDKKREWNDKNPDKIRLYNKERRMNKNHDISKEEWRLCKEYFDNACAYCGLSIGEHFKLWKGEMKQTDLHKEHVVHEGLNDLSNCVPSCQSCNSGKHIYVLDEWYNENNPNFNKERIHRIYKWLNTDYKTIINN